MRHSSRVTHTSPCMPREDTHFPVSLRLSRSESRVTAIQVTTTRVTARITVTQVGDINIMPLPLCYLLR